MPLAEYEASPREVRSFALLQIVLTAGFTTLIFVAIGGTTGPLPPWWLIAILLLGVAGAAFFAERVWLGSSPLDAGDDPDDLKLRAIGIYAAQTVRKLMFCEAAVIASIVVSFVGSWTGWLVLLVGVPGVVLLAFETWPSVRNLSMTAAMLEMDGAQTKLVESFRAWDDPDGR